MTSPSPAASFDPSGVLVVDKPSGLTSHDVVDKVRRAFGWKKVGHAGTLDPLATGVLILLVGKATRSQAQFLNSDKEYQGTMRLGVETDSHDADGEPTRRADPAEVEAAIGDPARIEAAFAAFRGEIRQLPPMVSAVKHKGKPLYKYERKGEEVPREERTVTIHRLEVLAVRPPDEVDLLCACTKGTYVRTLCHDIGRRLGCGAHLAALRRTRSGTFTATDARPLEEVLALRGIEAFYALRPLSEVLPPSAAAGA